MLLFIVILSSTYAISEEVQNKRAKIALVLSGGGARGIAHIGVIKTLEELNIPIDIIVGTSMGSIVGGLYASGMSSDELIKLIDLDWSGMFKDDPEREEKRYRIKKDDHKYLLKYGIGFEKGKLLLPKGLILGQKQIMLLKELTYDLYGTENFNDFPIQFRTVASDIETGNPVILSSGKLADAIRASMSVPGVFAPVVIDGKMLVDGGITNNIPIDVAMDLGADVIIAVDVGTPFDAGGKVSNVLNIAGQLSTFLVRKNSLEQIKKFKKEYNVSSEKALGESKGILLQPELGDIGSADFERGKEALDIGIETAMKQKEKLEMFSLSENEYQAFLEKQRKPAITAISLDFIDIDNHSRLSPNVIRSFINLEEGDVLDVKKLEKDISRIYGLDIFERVEYNIVKKGDRTGLVIETHEKSWGPNYINFGYNLYTNLNGSNEYNIGINLTRNPLNRFGGEWKNEFQFGAKARVYSEYYQPFDRYMNYFVAPFVEFEREDIDMYDNGNNIAKIRSRTYTAGIDIGRQFGDFGSFRIGVRRVDGRADVKIGDPGFGTNNFDRGGISSTFAYDTYDNYVFPNKGIKGDLSVDIDRESMGADESIESYSFKISGAKTWGRYTFVPGIDVSSVSDDKAPLEYTTRTGGFLNLSGFIPNELMGLYSSVGRMVFLRKMGNISDNPLYLGGSIEYGNVWDNSADIKLDSGIFAGSVFLGKDTLFGPIYLAYGIAEDNNRSFYISLGQPF